MYKTKSLLIEETDTHYCITQTLKGKSVDIVILSKEIFELRLREKGD